MSGILIGYVGRETKFWYPCNEREIKAHLLNHVANWSREMRDGVTVTTIPVEELVVTYCDGFDAQEQPINPRKIDAVKLLK